MWRPKFFIAMLVVDTVLFIFIECADDNGTKSYIKPEKYEERAISCSQITDFSQFSHVYSGKETVERARNSIGRSRYDLLIENCKNFAY